MSALALGVIAGWLVVLAAAFDIVLSLRLDQQIDDALRVRAQAASVTVEVSNGEIVRVRESPTDEALDASIWIYSGQTALARPRVSATAQHTADVLARGSAGFADRNGRRFLVQPILGADSREVGTIVAALELEPYDETRTTVVFGSAVVVLLLLAGAYPVLRFTSGRALRPVAAMTSQAAEWSHHDPSQRFGTGQGYQELDDLARSLDEVLDRLSALLRHERHLSAELSHELRTPLSRVTAQIELVREDVNDRLRAELDQIAANCAAMDGIIDTLLAAARTDLRPDLGSSSVREVITQFEDGGPSRGVSVQVRDTDLLVGVDPDIVARILAPIVDNARRFARSTIVIAAKRVPAGVAITVDNDGPPIAHDDAAHVFEAGFQGAPDGHDGAGLGLALALRLARAADGDVTVGEQDGHTVFTVSLPSG